MTVDACTFSGNFAPNGYGGGLLISSSTTAAPGDLVLRNSTFSGNSAKFQGGGFAWARHGEQAKLQKLAGSPAAFIRARVLFFAFGCEQKPEYRRLFGF